MHVWSPCLHLHVDWSHWYNYLGGNVSWFRCDPLCDLGHDMLWSVLYSSNKNVVICDQVPRIVQTASLNLNMAGCTLVGSRAWVNTHVILHLCFKSFAFIWSLERIHVPGLMAVAIVTRLLVPGVADVTNAVADITMYTWGSLMAICIHINYCWLLAKLKRGYQYRQHNLHITSRVAQPCWRIRITLR